MQVKTNQQHVFLHNFGIRLTLQTTERNLNFLKVMIDSFFR